MPHRDMKAVTDFRSLSPVLQLETQPFLLSCPFAVFYVIAAQVLLVFSEPTVPIFRFHSFIAENGLWEEIYAVTNALRSESKDGETVFLRNMFSYIPPSMI